MVGSPVAFRRANHFLGLTEGEIRSALARHQLQLPDIVTRHVFPIALAFGLR